ncbi:MAG: hypothetical protein H0U69_12315 [Trueperaceae bacterium]|nr:hypothetical protein [Trueperaceae bacterium]
MERSETNPSDAAAPSLGSFVGGLKAPREVLRDKGAFLERSAHKSEGPAVGGLPLVGLGGSCGKPAFLLPFVVRFDMPRLERLEEVAARYGMFVEYGAYPHLKLEDGGQEIAAVQDWTNATVLFLRPSFAQKDDLVAAMVDALR